MVSCIPPVQLALSGVLGLLAHVALNEHLQLVSFLGCPCCADSLPAPWYLQHTTPFEAEGSNPEEGGWQCPGVGQAVLPP